MKYTTFKIKESLEKCNSCRNIAICRASGWITKKGCSFSPSRYVEGEEFIFNEIIPLSPIRSMEELKNLKKERVCG